MDVKSRYDSILVGAILVNVGNINESNRYWGKLIGSNDIEILCRNLKEILSNHKKQNVVAPIDVFEFEITENKVNIWHLHYNKDRDYLVSTIINN